MIMIKYVVINHFCNDKIVSSLNNESKVNGAGIEHSESITSNRCLLGKQHRPGHLQTTACIR